MKIKYFFLTCFIQLLLVFCLYPAFGQIIEINTQQNITVSQTGFFPFSSEANETFKELVKENGSVAVIITNFDGTLFKIAPAADFREIGRLKKIKGDGTTIIEYKKQKGNSFGLSFRRGKKPTSVTIELQPFAGRPCPNPVNCQDDCGENLGKCCEKDSNGNQAKICIQVGTSSCGCAKR